MKNINLLLTLLLTITLAVKPVSVEASDSTESSQNEIVEEQDDSRGWLLENPLIYSDELIAEIAEITSFEPVPEEHNEEGVQAFRKETWQTEIGVLTNIRELSNSSISWIMIIDSREKPRFRLLVELFVNPDTFLEYSPSDSGEIFSPTELTLTDYLNRLSHFKDEYFFVNEEEDLMILFTGC